MFDKIFCYALVKHQNSTPPQNANVKLWLSEILPWSKSHDVNMKHKDSSLVF